MALSVVDKQQIKEYVHSLIKEYIDTLKINIQEDRPKNLKQYRQKLEKYLYMYNHLKENIKMREQDILNLEKEDFQTAPAVHRINKSGLTLTVEDKRKMLAGKIKKDIERDKMLINKLNTALNGIKEDRYYKIIPLIYFDNFTIEQIEEKLYCNKTTIYRNKKRLIDKMIVIFFGAVID